MVCHSATSNPHEKQYLVLCQRRVARGSCFYLGVVLGIYKGLRSSRPGTVFVVTGTEGVCDRTILLSVWNCVSTCCSCVCA